MIRRMPGMRLVVITTVLFLAAVVVVRDIIKTRLAARAKYATRTVKAFPFSAENSLKEWEEKIFKGKVYYTIEKDKGLSYVKAASNSAASALYYKIRVDAKGARPVISWRWKVDKFPVKNDPENLETQDTDDFAARVYVIFPSMFLTNSKVLEYIWAEKMPEGKMGTSPYSKNIKLIVAQSGPAKDGAWAFEERDIIADYMAAFGCLPEHDVGAIAFMTNTEHTGTSADAMYDEINIGYKADDKNKRGG